MGSSMAENHPVGFQWVIEAREKNGATIIHVDPRFNRTSAMADYWLPLRAGSDIVFLGAMINYTLSNERYFREYVVPYTNAATILQLLLGNIGRPGGGIMALRGHASIQGSTDIPTLYDMLPGYLPMPMHNADDDNNLAAWIKTHKSPAGWWNNIDKYIVSLLK